jgi:hypothetical protein
MYCLESWGSSYESTLEPIYMLQKKCIRIINRLKKCQSTDNFFLKCNILSVYKLFYFRISQLVYKEITGLNNTSVNFNFKKCAETHNHVTRAVTENKLYLESHSTTFYCQSVKSSGVIVYNKIPFNIRQLNSLNIFKRDLKMWILENKFDHKMLYTHV